MAKRGLGRGLEALLPGINKSEEMVSELLVKTLEVNPYQPRKFFEDEKLSELAASIREHGVVQPIVVRPVEKGRYQLIAGERRWRACMMLGMEKIPAIVKEVGEVEAREISLVENLQREELNPLEEAEAYRQLLQEFGFTQVSLAKRMGKSRSYIANSLRLLGLSDQLKERVREGVLTPGHAKVLLGVTDVQERERLGDEVIQQGLSVRETERLVKRTTSLEDKNSAGNRKLKKKEVLSEREVVNPEILDLEERLRDRLETKVRVKWNGENRGVIEIDFYGLEDLERIEEILGEGRV